MIWSIDRIEGGLAVCEGEDGPTKLIATALLPKDAGESDCISQDEAGNYFVDRAETRRRKARIQALQDKLFQHATDDHEDQ